MPPNRMLNVEAPRMGRRWNRELVRRTCLLLPLKTVKESGRLGYVILFVATGICSRVIGVSNGWDVLVRMMLRPVPLAPGPSMLRLPMLVQEGPVL